MNYDKMIDFTNFTSFTKDYLKQLSNRQKLIVIEILHHQRTNKEIAEILGVSPSTVSRERSKIYEGLKKELCSYL